MAYRYLTPVNSQPFLEKKNPDEVRFEFQKDSLKPFLLRLPNSEYMIFPGIRIFPKQNIVMFKAAIQTIANCDGIRKAVSPTLKTSLTRVEFF